eukprot:35168_1
MMFLLHLLLIGSICSADSHVCDNNSNCTMDCRYTQCSSWFIDGRKANSLTVLCGTSTNICKNTTILCSPQNNIYCNTTNSCNNLTIHYDYQNINHLNIDCSSDYACRYIKIYPYEHISNNTLLVPVPLPSSSANVTCYGIMSCNQGKFNLNYIDTINILCDSGHSSSSSIYSACGADIFYPSKNAIFDTSYSNNVYIICKSWDCYSAIFNSSLSKYLSLTCNSYVACGSTSVYCPYHSINACNIGCNDFDNPCRQMNLYVDHNFTYGYLSLSCHKKHYYDTWADTCSTVTHTCTGDEYDRLWPHYETQIRYINPNYYCSQHECCPWQAPLLHRSCNSSISKDCVIHCGSQSSNNCSLQLIDAREYDTLTIYCSSSYTCQRTKILCSNQCNIICDNAHSCENTDITYYHSTNYLSLQCNSEYSCYTTNIGTDAIDDTNPILYNLQADISCLTEYSCYKANFDFQNITYVSLQCNSKYSCYTDLWCPSHSPHSCNVTCIGDYSCSDMNIYVYSDYKPNYLSLNYDVIFALYYGVTFICDPSYFPLDLSEPAKKTDLINVPYSLDLICSSLNCCPFKDNITIVCLTNNCVIDCNDGCVGKYIDASNATSLVLLCGTANSCEGTSIICPVANDTLCSIECIGEKSCADAIIYGDSAFNNNVTVYCLNDLSCAVSNILANYSNKASLYVMGSYSFYFSQLYANNANDVLVDVIGIGYVSIYRSTIYGKNVSNSYNISCKNINPTHKMYGYIDQACMDTWFIAPLTTEPNKMKSTITCSGYGCYQIYLRSINGTNDFDITFNGCNICDLSECMYNTIFQCGYKYSISNSFLSDWTCAYPQTDCSCNQMLDSDHLRFIADSSCADYSCNGYDNCIVKCDTLLEYPSGCNYKLINGTNSKSFTLYCNEYIFGCNYSTIYCPNDECNIVCNSNISCVNINIYGVITNAINIHCMETNSCVNMSIYGNFSKNINILCDGVYGKCNNINIYADDSANININCSGYANNCNKLRLYGESARYISLLCYGSYSCNDVLIKSNHAFSLNISAIGFNALYYGDIYAENVQYFELNCMNKSACNNPNIYASNGSNIYCLGNSCSNLNLYATDSSIFETFTVSVNGCQYNDCMYIDECINAWSIYCGANYESVSQFYGSQCSNTNCNCGNLVDIATKLFANNMETFNCTTTITLLPTELPTIVPTVSSILVPPTAIRTSITTPILVPSTSIRTSITTQILDTNLTNNASINDTYSSNSSTLIIVIIVICCMGVILIGIGCVAYAYWYRKQNKRKEVEKQTSIVLMTSQ